MRPLLIGATFVFLAGCASGGNPKLMNEAVLEQIELKRTTQEQVQMLLGTPTTMTTNATNDGRPSALWGYNYWHTSFNPLGFVPVVNLVVLICCGLSDTEGRAVALGFGTDGRLMSKSVTKIESPVTP
jgi:hypothetical protein